MLYDAAVWKNDESMLLHIRDRDLASGEARYHRPCYYKYTKDYANMLAKSSRQKDAVSNSEENSPFEQFSFARVQQSMTYLKMN